MIDVGVGVTVAFLISTIESYVRTEKIEKKRKQLEKVRSELNDKHSKLRKQVEQGVVTQEQWLEKLKDKDFDLKSVQALFVRNSASAESMDKHREDLKSDMNNTQSKINSLNQDLSTLDTAISKTNMAIDSDLSSLNSMKGAYGKLDINKYSDTLNNELKENIFNELQK